MSALVPHPWDAIAPPPPLGPSYEPLASPVPVDEALQFAELWRRIEELRDDAQRFEEEAYEKEQEAKKLEPALEAVEGLADAIGSDPYGFARAEEVMAWAAAKGPAR